jgi:hypothetical protein
VGYDVAINGGGYSKKANGTRREILYSVKDRGK